MAGLCRVGLGLPALPSGPLGVFALCGMSCLGVLVLLFLQYRFLLDTEKGESSSNWQEYSEDFAGHPGAGVVAESGDYAGLPLHAAFSMGPHSVLIFSQ